MNRVVVITVAEVHQPQPGKKQGKVIDQTGKVWYVWADKVNNYRPGSVWAIDKIKSSMFQGQMYNTIMDATPLDSANPGLAAAPHGAPTQSYAPSPKPSAVPQPSMTQKDEMIFVCGVVNNLAGNQNNDPTAITAQTLIQWVNHARQAWRNTFGKVQADEDMDDQIPF